MLKYDMEDTKKVRWQKISAVSKTKLGAVIPTVIFACMMLSGCVKDELYDTPHPDKGAVVITTDWADALAEATVPDAYFLSMDDGKAKEVRGTTNCYPDLLAPSRHTLLVYNEPQGMTVSGTTATIGKLGDGTLTPLPDYLFSAMKELDVAQDDTLRVTVPMVRRLCPIVLNLSLEGENTEEIASITATLDGIAASVDLQTGAVGSENATVTLDVRQAEAKMRAYTEGKLEMKCRVVGINPQERQQLTIKVTMEDGYESITTSDLTEYLKDLNADMEPIRMEGSIEAPQDGHFSGTIKDWDVVSGGDIDAN